MDGRRIIARSAVGDADIARFGLRGIFHQPRNVGKRGRCPGGGDPYLDGPVKIKRAGMNRVANCHCRGADFAGQQRQVEARCAVDDLPICCQPLACCDQHHHVGFQLSEASHSDEPSAVMTNAPAARFFSSAVTPSRARSRITLSSQRPVSRKNSSITAPSK